MAANNKQNYYELYRRSSVGEALTDTLEELLMNQYISSSLYQKILSQFDKSINEALSNTVKSKTTFKGNLHTYRFCDNVWTFILDNASFKTDGVEVKVKRVKIVACDANVQDQPPAK
ncbi:transcription initiation factor IIA gamma chain [Dictyostelium purpureum]|uniref:Transcription initiation factor IIA subunit 2 n=1 Tax=Dictyostelium purpureum TaxID=5786 RepID=F0ZDA5_DICPU|nr:transcription initiation factor IIA gamma chain [Dictyostelium purpureum]EGC38103.1 transcription initiation factor IIA gamma chain [Dictyostelium purpureum]|eukprot:XP_003285410.1 transcription initiation factor IIA gamma chain [Dictyostelium purpureum]